MKDLLNFLELKYYFESKIDIKVALGVSPGFFSFELEY